MIKSLLSASNLRALWLTLIILTSYISAVIGLPILAIYLYVKYPYEVRGAFQRFDKAAWREAVSDAGSDWKTEAKLMKCVRGNMVRDLRRNHFTQPGFSQEDMRDLLGPPDDYRRVRGQLCFTYLLGTLCTVASMDYDKLYVCFKPGEGFEQSFPALR